MNLLKKLLLCLSFALLMTSQLFAGGTTRVNKINLSGLDEFRGLMLTAFYVSARPAALGTPGSRPQIREVLKIAGPFEIHGQGNPVGIPATDIVVEGFKSYNYVVFVVHSPYIDTIAIRNTDGKVPAGLEKLDLTGTDEMSPFNHKYDFSVNRATMLTELDKSNNTINLVVRPRLVNYQPN